MCLLPKNQENNQNLMPRKNKKRIIFQKSISLRGKVRYAVAKKMKNLQPEKVQKMLWGLPRKIIIFPQTLKI